MCPFKPVLILSMVFSAAQLAVATSLLAVCLQAAFAPKAVLDASCEALAAASSSTWDVEGEDAAVFSMKLELLQKATLQPEQRVNAGASAADDRVRATQPLENTEGPMPLVAHPVGRVPLAPGSPMAPRNIAQRELDALGMLRDGSLNESLPETARRFEKAPSVALKTIGSWQPLVVYTPLAQRSQNDSATGSEIDQAAKKDLEVQNNSATENGTEMDDDADDPGAENGTEDVTTTMPPTLSPTLQSTTDPTAAPPAEEEDAPVPSGGGGGASGEASCAAYGCSAKRVSSHACQCTWDCMADKSCCPDFVKTCVGRNAMRGTCEKIGCGNSSGVGCGCKPGCESDKGCCLDYHQVCPERDIDTCAKQGCHGTHPEEDEQVESSCNCRLGCKDRGDCCRDYLKVCSKLPTPAPTPAPTKPEGKCATYGCQHKFVTEQTCQCTDDCSRHRNCCPDYPAVCRDTCAHTGCGNRVRSRRCQCSKDCVKRNSCCRDFHQWCGPRLGGAENASSAQ
eukprot:TRINITY_DN22581_c0_g1_i1.p1 TRINITY_DN22581_c0_g1~~TRINITY_DN22581_c0_g1_i1.p1  ORF type:complete len:510 (+),score=91.65 TRINITY_DN22581_c0_g1_i1:44-1573(+)